MTFDPLWLAMAPGALAVTIWAFIDLQRFVLFAVLLAMNMPTALAQPGGAQVAAADLLLLVALFVWLVSGSVGNAPRPWLTGNKLLAPGLLFVAVNAMSLAWSDQPRATATFTIQLVEIVIVFPLIFASLPNSIKVIRQAMFAWVVLTSGMAVICIGIFLAGAANTAAGTASLPFDLNKNTIGSYLAAGLVIAYALGVTERHGRTRHLLQFAMLFELLGAFSTLSRGSILGAIAGVLVVSLLLRRRRVLTCGLMAIVATGYIATSGIDSNADLSMSGSYDSSQVRVYAFDGAIEKFKDKPLLGTGAGTYRDVLPQLESGFIVPDPNNMFLLTAGELGIIGLLALLFLLFRYGRLLFDAGKLPDDAAVPAVAAGCVTLSLFVHFQVDVTWTRGTTSLAFAMMGLMIAIQRIAAQTTDVRMPERVQEPPPTRKCAVAGVA